MSKKCAKCEKTVYPIEELKCLDKMWHKACFKCWECGMTLNMKNYKGYDKKPYCNAHYPQTKATVVADTPELARIAQNTKIQSQTQYHSDFEKSKGRYTAVTDDPEMKRHLSNTQKNSMVKYHEDFEKNIKGSKITVTDEPEMQRLKQNQGIVSQVQYHGLKEKAAHMEQRRPAPGSVSVEAPAPKQVGSIGDYDPMNDQWGSIAGGYKPRTSSGTQEWEEVYPAPQQNQPPPPRATQPPPQQQNSQQSQPDYNSRSSYQREPEPQQYRDSYGNRGDPYQSGEPAPVPSLPINQPVAFQMRQEPEPAYQPPAPQPEPPRNSNPYAGAVFRAMYDYDAADSDEVGFRDGDMIINCQPIDDGWMFGTVKSTGQSGMLPANYVEMV